MESDSDESKIINFDETTIDDVSALKKSHYEYFKNSLSGEEGSLKILYLHAGKQVTNDQIHLKLAEEKCKIKKKRAFSICVFRYILRLLHSLQWVFLVVIFN